MAYFARHIYRSRRSQYVTGRLRWRGRGIAGAPVYALAVTRANSARATARDSMPRCARRLYAYYVTVTHEEAALLFTILMLEPLRFGRFSCRARRDAASAMLFAFACHAFDAADAFSLFAVITLIYAATVAWRC